MRIFIQYTFQEMFELTWYLYTQRKLKIFVDYHFEHLLLLFVVERRYSKDHLIDEDAQSPPIYIIGVTFIHYYLGTYGNI